jgi:hypothetical protein
LGAAHQLHQEKHQDMRQKRLKLTSASWLRPVCGCFHNLIRFNCVPFFASCRRHHVLTATCLDAFRCAAYVGNTGTETKGIFKIVVTGKWKPDAIGTGLPDLLVHTFKCINNEMVIRYWNVASIQKTLKWLGLRCTSGGWAPVSIVDLFLGDYVRFEVSTAVTIKNVVFWDVPSCRSCVNQRFGGTYQLHLQGRKIRDLGTQDLHDATSQKTAFSISGRFMLDKVTLQQIYLEFLWFSPANQHSIIRSSICIYHLPLRYGKPLIR